MSPTIEHSGVTPDVWNFSGYTRLVPVLLATSLWTTACATTALTPATTAVTVAGTTDVALNQADGVRVTAQSDAWSGDGRIAEAVQPIRVTITNDGSSPIRVRYSDFALVAPNGHRYAALPPFKVEGEIDAPALNERAGLVLRPAFYYRNFYVAPYFARLYPGLPVWGARYALYDPTYYGLYYPYFARSIRPTVEMLSLALPEGVIAPGGQLSGFVYFQHVDPKVPSVTFRESLVAVGSGGKNTTLQVGEISIPFVVKRVSM